MLKFHDLRRAIHRTSLAFAFLAQLFSLINDRNAVSLEDRGIAALPNFFGKCCTIISQRGPKDVKKEKKLLPNVHKHSYLYIRTFPYNISLKLIGYGVFRKQASLSKTQNCENVELTVSKNCTAVSSLMTPSLSFPQSCGPRCTK